MRLLVLGHTHYPMVKVVNGITVVNPGSVGQPRNSIPGAHWAVWDTARMAIDLRCEKYDYQQVVAESRVRHPELPYLANVLSRT
ncbi:MAG: metallophosphoesterase family protein [Verrucomicrobia bacterium]|nr:metallophosphoesterase family protein [Verrucomicrobiota bacterium]